MINDVSIWINPLTEEALEKKGFKFNREGNCRIYLCGVWVGYLDNFTGITIKDEFVHDLVKIISPLPGAVVWNYKPKTKYDKRNVIDEISTHKAVKNPDGTIDLWEKGIILDDEDGILLYRDELVRKNVYEDDIFAYFERWEEDNRINVAEATEEFKNYTK